MEVLGIIEKVLTLESGTSKQGKEWQKQNFIVANNEGYEGKKQIFCFEIFGEEKVQNFNKFNKEGDTVKVNFRISTNENNGRYFTSLAAWSVFKGENGNNTAPVSAGDQFLGMPKEAPSSNNEEPEDDLPF